MNTATIYHNPRCAKSREALALLEKSDVEVNVIEYFQQRFKKTKLEKILALLNISARDLLRTSEEKYKTLRLSNELLSEAKLIKFMQQYPELIQRPIVICNKKAVIGRPPEKVLTILG